MKTLQKYSQVLLIMAVVLLALMISFFRLGSTHLVNWDESFYADGVRWIRRSGEVIVPHWNKDVFLDKPPLHIWLASLSTVVWGMNEFGYRFSSAVCLTLLIILVYHYTQRRYGQVAGVTAVAALLVNAVLIWRARTANTDSLLTILIFIFFWITQEKHRWRAAFLGGVLSAIAMTKSTVVLFPLGALVLYETRHVWERQTRIQGTKIVVFLSMFLTLPLLWLGLGEHQLPGLFIQYYLFKSDGQAAQLRLSQFDLQYLKATLRALNVLLPVVVVGYYMTLKKHFDRGWLVVLMTVPYGLLLTFSSSHYHWYLMPAAPVWAILAGVGMARVWKLLSQPLVRSLLLSVYIFLIGGQFVKNILPLFYLDSAYVQATAGRMAERIVPAEEPIVRLDQQYPTYVYYSDRYILVSSADTTTSESYFVSRADLVQGIETGTFHWIAGTTDECQKLLRTVRGRQAVVYTPVPGEQLLYFP